MLEGSVVIKLKQIVHGVPYTDVGLNSNMPNGWKWFNKSQSTPLANYFLGNILQMFLEFLKIIFLASFKISF
jgi:hypothetical protein